MISPVAEQCFWLHRYVERAENTARLLRVSRSFFLDMNLPDLERWQPVIIVSGEMDRFTAFFPAATGRDGEVVQDYFHLGRAESRVDPELGQARPRERARAATSPPTTSGRR
jgi:uncharacterized alpha-E superfamily protein